MIAFLKGKIILKTDKFLILNVNGIGYKVFLSKESLDKVSDNPELFCFQHVRENSLALYGFLSYPELELFEFINDISGIGPKVALEISCIGSLKEFKERLGKEQEKVFQGIPGLGSKRIQKIILEVSGKIASMKPRKTREYNEVEETLVNLGFPRQKVKEILPSLTEKDTEARIKQALKLLGR